MIYKLITFKLSFTGIVRLSFLFMAYQIKYKHESQKSKNLHALFVSNFLFTIYPGWDLA